MSAGRSIITFAAAVFLTAPLAAQEARGVKVQWAIEGAPGAGPQEMTQYIAPSEVLMTRLELSGAGGQVILVTNGDTRIMLVPEQKMWMDLVEMEALGARMGMPTSREGAGSDEVPDLQPTGETGRFADTDCTYYRFTNEGAVTEICAATGLGWSMGPGAGGGMMGGRGGMGGRGAPGGLEGTSAMSSRKYGELRRRFANGFFPLEIRQLREGQAARRTFATAIERQAMSADLFPTGGPEGYQKMSMTGRGRG